MPFKRPFVFIMIGSVMVVLALWLVLPAAVAQAQCGPNSSCKTCHEAQKQDPVSSQGQWHIDHAYLGYCVPCHAGNNTAQAKEQAHAGTITKFQDMGGRCQVCHKDDLNTKLSVYAKLLNVSDTSTIKITDSNINGNTSDLGSFFGSPAQVVDAASIPGQTASPPQNPALNLALGGALAALVLGGGGYITWNERRLKKLRGPRKDSLLVALLRKESWSPYAAGVLLGLTGILAVLVAHNTLGASGAISSIASNAVNAAAPEAASNSMYFKFIMPPGFNWEIALLIGVFFGGMLGALSSGTFKLRWNGDPTWQKVFGAQRWKRFSIGFLGAMILQYGAGIAGGCTSGLAISGGMLLAPSAFLFMAGMFASGIIVALIVFRRRY